ncbi:mechanosensitive ion channel family protein [Sulfitobacter sp. S190]|uniref:mechanosensitive ion channel family protein n=1 Tax=Sulfitobacter sp. S190 TaxID=2867022 RepID=UPI0021A91441|nr:mechanosensitive ion channel family protein [Sulfitobacter sp. S190]UWR21960.1 mechanosensitive ion channel family protein [Sulfitobacter sp. S190]
MRSLLSCLLVFLLLTLAGALPGGAQGVGSLFTSDIGAQEDTSASDELAATLKQAAEQGVGIIVIDTNGNVLTQTPAAATDTSAEDGAMARGSEMSGLMKAQSTADQFRDLAIERIRDLPNSYNEVLYILRAASPTGEIYTFFKALWLSLLLFGIGVLVEIELFGKRFARKFVVARTIDAPQGYAEKMPFLAFRFFLGVVGALVSVAVAYIIGILFLPPLEDSAMQFTVTLINVGYLGCRFVAGVWRMVLSPFLPQYRIPIMSDRAAKRLHRWLWITTSFNIIGILFGIWLAELGLNRDITAVFVTMMSGIMVLLSVALVLTNRRAISNALRHGKAPADCGTLMRFLAQAWAPAVILYVVVAWLSITYQQVVGIPFGFPLIAGAYAILLSILVVYGVINFVIERGFARARAVRILRAEQAEREAAEQSRLQEVARAQRELQEDGPDEDADPTGALEADSPAGPLKDRIEPAQPVEIAATDALSSDEIDARSHQLMADRARAAEIAGNAPRVLNSYEDLARRVAGILAFVAGAYAFLNIWENESTRMVANTTNRLLDVIIIMFIGYIVYHLFRIWIDTKIAEESGDDEEGELGDEGGGSSASRLATLLPLFRNLILIVVVVSIGLIVLMELGVNVGPLFAGAGIVGIAVGFGSQALVQDIFAGAFFLLDDAFRKGEYLDVGGVKGTVEKISVRSFQLRHHLGALHTIPFGQLQVMTNYSRDWVIMKLPLRVTYDTDVETVRKLIKKLGQELLSDPVIGDNFIQPLKSQGVIEMQDSAMIIRVKFMTKPGDQWLVRKKVYEEIRVLFEREGVKFAHREVTVRLANGNAEDLTEEQKREVAAAAHASLEEDLLEGEEAGGGDDR